MRLAVFALVPMLAVGVAAFAACGGESDPIYGPPGGLRNAQLPPPQGTSTATTPTDSGAPPSDAAMGGDVQVMNCTVSFKTQIYPKMLDTGPWKCADATCHGGNTPPAISPTDSNATYAALKAYVINGKNYLNTASTDPTQSSFDCNLKGTCGAGQMPQVGGTVGATAATTTEITMVDTWLTCGSPNN